MFNTTCKREFGTCLQSETRRRTTPRGWRWMRMPSCSERCCWRRRALQRSWSRARGRPWRRRAPSLPRLLELDWIECPRPRTTRRSMLANEWGIRVTGERVELAASNNTCLICVGECQPQLPLPGLNTREQDHNLSYVYIRLWMTTLMCGTDSGSQGNRTQCAVYLIAWLNYGVESCFWEMIWCVCLGKFLFRIGFWCFAMFVCLEFLWTLKI